MIGKINNCPLWSNALACFCFIWNISWQGTLPNLGNLYHPILFWVEHGVDQRILAPVTFSKCRICLARLEPFSSGLRYCTWMWIFNSYLWLWGFTSRLPYGLLDGIFILWLSYRLGDWSFVLLILFLWLSLNCTGLSAFELFPLVE